MTGKTVAAIVAIIGSINLMGILWYAVLFEHMSGWVNFLMTSIIVFLAIVALSERKK